MTQEVNTKVSENSVFQFIIHLGVKGISFPESIATIVAPTKEAAIQSIMSTMQQQKVPLYEAFLLSQTSLTTFGTQLGLVSKEQPRSNTIVKDHVLPPSPPHNDAIVSRIDDTKIVSKMKKQKKQWYINALQDMGYTVTLTKSKMKP